MHSIVMSKYSGLHYLYHRTVVKLIAITIYVHTVGPRLSKHLCATSMLKVSEFVRISV